MVEALQAAINFIERQGAVLTESAEDILRALDGLFAKPLAEPKAFEIIGPSPDLPSQDELEKARLEIEQSLGPEPVMVDEIIRNCQMSLPVVSMVLLELELAGRLERHSGNQVSLVLM